MFQPTHYLVSRTRQIPVELITTPQGAALLTEEEARQGQPAAFSMHPKRGFFCHDIQVIGFRLEPIAHQTKVETTQAVPVPNAATSSLPSASSIKSLSA